MAENPVSPLRLGLNIDHVATVRNARGGSEPDPVRAARLALEQGVDGITAHLREDRRHIRDADIAALQDLCSRFGRPLNLEMALSDEMIAIALTHRPQACCLVPEKRQERTTEGGLDLHIGSDALARAIQSLKSAQIRVSLFVEPDRDTMKLAHALGADVVELHTGRFCEAVRNGASDEARRELDRLILAARAGDTLGLEIHAGHGLDYESAPALAAIPQIVELNIGHFLIGDAIFIGLPAALDKMRQAMQLGRRSIASAPESLTS